jgi:hypothetical protein
MNRLKICDEISAASRAYLMNQKGSSDGASRLGLGSSTSLLAGSTEISGPEETEDMQEDPIIILPPPPGLWF